MHTFEWRVCIAHTRKIPVAHTQSLSLERQRRQHHTTTSASRAPRKNWLSLSYTIIYTWARIYICMHAYNAGHWTQYPSRTSTSAWMRIDKRIYRALSPREGHFHVSCNVARTWPLACIYTVYLEKKIDVRCVPRNRDSGEAWFFGWACII